MNVEYTYAKKRMQFGRRCNFSDFDKAEMEIRSNPALMSNYVRTDPVSHATQCSKVFALHEVMTIPKSRLLPMRAARNVRFCVAGEYNHGDL